MSSPVQAVALRRRVLSGASYGLALLAAFCLIAWTCRTPELGSRLHDQGRLAEAVPLLEVAAEAGSIPSSHRLALLLEAGETVPADPWRAMTLHLFAAGRGYLPSMVRAGDLLRRLVGDQAGAAVWYRRAVAQGDAKAMARLGAMTLDGAGVAKNTDEGLRLLRRGADSGLPEAATALGRALLALGEAGDPRGGKPQEAAALFLAASQSGDAEAMGRLGDLYATGRGVPRDLAQAVSWRRKAAEAGYAPAAHALGLMYLSGQGVTAYPLEAARLFERAAKTGHVPAMLQLADMYFEGLGVFRDRKRAMELYDAAGSTDAKAAAVVCRLFAAGDDARRDPQRAARFCRAAADAGDAASATLLGLGMLRGRIPGDTAAGTALLSKAAWAGDAEAMYAMALLHLAGQGVASNPTEAFRWCNQAAAAGLPEAKGLLAALSEEELPSAANLAKAMEFYREAAQAGDTEAGFALGSLLSKGLAGPPDFAEARQWYEKAAQAGDARAQFNLGLMYLTGKGGPVNDKEALRLMLAAARQGDPHARFNVASLTLTGRGTAADPEEAFRWYRLAAGQGFAPAQALLAGFFYEGRVVPRDFESALFWLALAGRSPGADPLLLRAAKAKTVLEKRMTPDQLERVSERLAAYKPAPFDPNAEKALLAGLKFLPPSARGPGFSPMSRAFADMPAAPAVSQADPKALF
jgi:TPR repeat protein